MNHDGPDFGPTDASGATIRPVVVEIIAETPTRSIKRARRGDALDRLDIEPEWRKAARIYQRAVEHMAAGIGMGPIEVGREVTRTGEEAPLFWGPQERALSAADWHRRGVQAMGVVAAHGVIQWVVIDGKGVRAYDAVMGWRAGVSSGVLRTALTALADEYFGKRKSSAA